MKTQNGQSANLEDFREIVQNIQAVYKQAIIVYKLQIDDIIKNKNISQDEIEYLFDGMLDFCDNAQMLLQYNRLCQYYSNINPQVVSYYINAYKELWGNESKTE
jgi:hypothetical protein